MSKRWRLERGEAPDVRRVHLRPVPRVVEEEGPPGTSRHTRRLSDNRKAGSGRKRLRNGKQSR